jgi:hypothetical protein
VGVESRGAFLWWRGGVEGEGGDGEVLWCRRGEGGGGEEGVLEEVGIVGGERWLGTRWKRIPGGVDGRVHWVLEFDVLVGRDEVPVVFRQGRKERYVIGRFDLGLPTRDVGPREELGRWSTRRLSRRKRLTIQTRISEPLGVI